MGDFVTNTHLATHTAGYSVIKKSLASPMTHVLRPVTCDGYPCTKGQKITDLKMCAPAFYLVLLYAAVGWWMFG